MSQRFAGTLCTLFTLAVLLWLAPAAAQDQAPFLWRIDGARTTHYLLGSIHLLPESEAVLPPAYERALKASDVVVFETDFDALQEPDTQQRFLTAARAPMPGGLRGQLHAETYHALSEHLGGLGLPAESFDSFKPWFVAMSLELLRYQRAGFAAEYGIDGRLFKRALDGGKTIEWLESVDQQIHVLSGMGPAVEEAYLRAAIEEDQPSGPQPEALLRIWRQSDTAALAENIAEMKSDYPEIYWRVLSGRNAGWLANLRQRLDGRKPTMIVVGAAHLVGGDGLLQTLEADGYTPTPVEADMAPTQP